jgi:hypothetical protein
METIFRNVDELGFDDRSALERVIGHPLHECQRIIIQVREENGHQADGRLGVTDKPGLPDWCNLYDGLSDAEVEEIASAIVRTPGGRGE